MSTKKNKAQSTSESAPIKQLVLRREKVRDLGVRSGVNTGYVIGASQRNPGSGQGGSGGIASVVSKSNSLIEQP